MIGEFGAILMALALLTGAWIARERAAMMRDQPIPLWPKILLGLVYVGVAFVLLLAVWIAMGGHWPGDIWPSR